MNIGKDANGGMRKLSWEPPKMQTCGRSAENTSRLHLRDGGGGVTARGMTQLHDLGISLESWGCPLLMSWACRPGF